jgi:ABC-2 type transport system permease protein
VRLYWHLACLGFKRHSTYRTATFAGCFTNTVWGFMLAQVLVALYQARSLVAGYDVTAAVTYVWISQGLLATVSIYGWIEIAQRVRTGDIATDFQRPIDFQGYWLAQDLGRGVFHALFRGIPPVLVASLAFHLRFPAHPLTWLWFAASVLLAVCLSFALRFIINLTSFWVHDHRGIISVTSFAFPFLSGLFGIPLAFLPTGLYRVLAVLPFAGMAQTPLGVYLERPEALATTLVQVAWVVVLLAAGRLVLRAAERRLVVQGG